MKLPMFFFDLKLTGDILQRFEDHKRLENFITVQSLNVLYAILSFFVFGGVLLYFNIYIFLTFLIGSILYISWLLLFMKKRKVLDYQLFEQRATKEQIKQINQAIKYAEQQGGIKMNVRVVK